jgi:valyl-tRNA synthetase
MACLAVIAAVPCSVPRSQRGGEVVEPLVSEQWFVRMAPLAEPALAAVADGSITIMPERFEKIYNMWLENIKVGGAYTVITVTCVLTYFWPSECC